ncbi:hypothetical protein P3X46_012979 [Hevea brasiliensis]|uniref:CASP-like protein n=1 Tax=Hevea brasiliensis TaxID=3981 RepID=A0ABQ9ME87_HEVBR|nr:hypothetical protein P3X46_012979 [Hevea brasiliensis]
MFFFFKKKKNRFFPFQSILKKGSSCLISLFALTGGLSSASLFGALSSPLASYSSSWVYIAHQMSFDFCKKNWAYLWCDFGFMSRGRLWCSQKIVFRHWT